MASNKAIVGTGAAVAGLGGLAAAALSVGAHENEPTSSKTAAAEQVETRTVVIRTVEHRTIHLKPHHVHHAAAPRAASTAALAPAPAPAPVVQATPVRLVSAPATSSPVRTRTSGTTHTTAPVRTRTSGSTGRSGDDGHEGSSSARSADD